MRYTIYFLLIFGLSFVFIGVTMFIKEPAAHIPKVVNGVIDLREMDDFASSVVHLDGEWDFYWQSFTHSQPDQVKENNKLTIVVPSGWEATSANKANISNLGYGTYQLTIQIPDEYVQQSLGLYISSVATSYKLWIDGEFIAENGKIGTNRDEMIPVNYARTFYFEPESATIDVTLEVANFSQRKGGLWESIQFGTAKEIALLRDKNVAVQLVVVGALVIMGIYNIFIFILRRSLNYTMFLGVLCLMYAVRTLLVGETFLINLFPTFSWEIQVKLEYLPTVLSLPLFMKYVNELYEVKGFKVLERIAVIVGILSTAIVLATPAIFYTKYLMVFLLVIPLAIPYFGYVFLNAYFTKRPASLFTLIGFSIFIITVINDSIYFLNFTNNGVYSSAGFFIFILSQTFAHAIRFSNAHDQIEKLSHELLKINRSLEMKVEERTKELSLLYSRLRKSENERKSLMSDLAHEISKPLTLIKGYSEAMVDEKLPPEKAYLQIIHRNANISERLIHDLSELSKLETRQLKMIFQKVNLASYPEHIFQHHRWMIENKGKKFIWRNEVEWKKQIPDHVFINIDPDRMNQVFINIIENALHHAPEGENIYLHAAWQPFIDEEVKAEVALTLQDVPKYQGELIGECVLQITDEGKGIPQEDIPFIFKRLYRGGSKTEDTVYSRGLGLAISKETVEMHGGKIWVESEVNKGSTFHIALPVFQLKGV